MNKLFLLRLCIAHICYSLLEIKEKWIVISSYKCVRHKTHDIITLKGKLCLSHGNIPLCKRKASLKIQYLSSDQISHDSAPKLLLKLLASLKVSHTLLLCISFILFTISRLPLTFLFYARETFVVNISWMLVRIML